MEKKLQFLIDYCLVMCLICFPFTVNLALTPIKDLDHPILSANLSVADVLIGLVFILWILKVFLFSGWKTVKLPPTPLWIFAATVVISFVNSSSLGSWAKETIQMVEYFIVFYILLSNNLVVIQQSKLIAAIRILTSFIIIGALIQHYLIDADPYLIRGFFENRNVLGSYLCIALPLIINEIEFSDSVPVKIWSSILIIFSLTILVSGSAIVAITIGVIFMYLLQERKKWYSRLIILSLTISLMLFILPSKNADAVKEFFSFYEQGNVSDNYYRRLTYVNLLHNKIFLNRTMGDNVFSISMNDYLNGKVPNWKAKKGLKFKEMDRERHVKNRYIEMFASINMLDDYPLFGVGVGNYQNHIGSYFFTLPKVNTAEPGQNNTYLVIASTTGFFGLSAFLWLLFTCIKRIQFRVASGHQRKKNIVYGLAGSLVAIIVEGFFSMILGATLLVPLVFLIYLSLDDENNKMLPYESTES